MTTYVVSHYHHNPRLNSKHIFTNYLEAQEEFQKIQSDEPTTQCSYMEIVGESSSWKIRFWHNRRASHVFGNLRKGKRDARA